MGLVLGHPGGERWAWDLNPALLISEPPLAGHTASSSGIFGGVKRLRNEPARPVGHSGEPGNKGGCCHFQHGFPVHSHPNPAEKPGRTSTLPL